MMDKIKARLSKIDIAYFSIVQQGLKYLEDNSTIDNNETINIFHRPWVAPQNWAINLFDSAIPKWIVDFTKRTGREIPNFYKNFLGNLNGCFIYDMSLYGLPPTIYENRVLSRTRLQCHDLTAANIHWIHEFEIEKTAFHFGGCSLTDDENSGYFYLNDEIISIRPNGEILNKWIDFSVFLADEIQKAEKRMINEIPDR
jgi:hypothetical protein